MNTELATRPGLDKAIENALIQGDLKDLNADGRLSFYKAICESLGLNPLTKPFAYITLNGKLQLYALKDCTEQLRKVHGVSITKVDPKQIGDLIVVVADAKDRDGRVDSSTGAVNAGGLKGENLANAMMKAETKAKRRVTLSICGLGMLDETEIQTLREQGVATETQGNTWQAHQNSSAPQVDPPQPASGADTVSQATNDSVTSAAKTATSASDPQQYPYAILAGTTLTCTPLTITEKKRTVPKTETNPEGTQPYIFVYFKGNVKTVSEFSCFDTGLFEAIRAGLNHECQFQVEVKDDKNGKMRINVKDALYIDGDKYVGGKPVIQAQQ
jgi:hypothetical protein